MNERARAVWAVTRVRSWPGGCRLVSLPPELLPDAATLLARAAGGFAALLLERDEVSLVLPEAAWQASALRGRERAEAGPYRAVTLDVDVELDVTGYLAPAATLLAEAGIPIVPVCGFLKDHLLVREADLERAVAVLEGLAARCRFSPPPAAPR